MVEIYHKTRSSSRPLFDAPQAVEILRDAVRPDSLRRPWRAGRVNPRSPQGCRRRGIDAAEHRGTYDRNRLPTPRMLTRRAPRAKW